MKAKIEETDFPQTLHSAIKYFANEDRALDFMKAIRWPDGIVKCPRCGATDVSFLATRRIWKCKQAHEKQQFSVKVGTVLEDSPISLDKWLCGFWLIANAKNGISSYELHRSLGVTQKTAWFMLHRIRLAMQDGSIEKMKGTVEADETFIGGLRANMKKSKKAQFKGAGTVAMTPVMGLLERNTPDKCSRVRLKVVKTTRKHELQAEVRQHVEKGADVYTDAHHSYVGLSDEYAHQFIDHAECYAKGAVHTNGLENFWALLKRGIHGTYVNVEPFHLFRYLDEQAFRFNERKDNDAGRFVKVVSGIIGKGLRYAKLTGKVGADGLPKPPMSWAAKSLMIDFGFSVD
jgi:transposase-like protein